MFGLFKKSKEQEVRIYVERCNLINQAFKCRLESAEIYCMLASEILPPSVINAEIGAIVSAGIIDAASMPNPYGQKYMAGIFLFVQSLKQEDISYSIGIKNQYPPSVDDFKKFNPRFSTWHAEQKKKKPDGTILFNAIPWINSNLSKFDM